MSSNVYMYTFGSKVYIFGLERVHVRSNVYTFGSNVYTFGSKVYTFGSKVYTLGCKARTRSASLRPAKHP